MNISKLSNTDLNLNTNNKSYRMPICFCIEESSSMFLHKLTNELNNLIRTIETDPKLKAQVELALVSYNAQGIKTDLNFTPLNGNQKIHLNNSNDVTSPKLGAALSKCIEMCQIRKCDYNNVLLNYYQPTIILISSGNHSDDVIEVKSKIKRYSARGILKLFPLSISEKNRKTSLLKELSSDGNIYESLDGAYDRLFKVLGKSIQRLSVSTSKSYDALIDATVDDWKRLARL